MPDAPPHGPAAAARPSGALVAALAGLALLIVALTVTPITNNDLFLHLRTGRIILETGRVPRVDDYSALARGRPFIAHEWLAGVIFRLAEAAGGFDALILLKCAVALAVALALYRAARASGAAPEAALPCLALVMILAAARFLERPHIFAWLILACFLALLARRRTRRLAGAGGGLWMLPVLQIGWANLHGSFVLGPSLVALAAVSEALEGLGLVPWPSPPGAAARRERLREAARLLTLSLLLVAVCLLNPYGAALLRFPFELTGSTFMEQIYEWLPPYAPPFRSTYMALYYAAWTLLGGWVLVAAGRRARGSESPPTGAFPFLVFGAFFALSLRMNRNVTDFALATMPGVAALLTWVRSPRPGGQGGGARLGLPGLPWIAAALVALAAWFAVAGYAYSPSGRRRPGLGVAPSIPSAAADYLARRGITGNCFNTYSAGAYLVYRFHPAVRVGMDSRNDVYGEALYDDYRRALGSAEELSRMLLRLDASFVFLEWPQTGMSATGQALRQIPGDWRLVYFDDDAVVYLSAAGRYREVARGDVYAILDPSQFRPGAWGPADAAGARAEADRAVAAGGGYIARVMRIEALRALGRDGDAAIDEARIVAEDPPLAHIQALLGLVHLARGERDPALARLRRALALNPYSEGARAALDQATRLR